jgi:chorismate dehydratase
MLHGEQRGLHELQFTVPANCAEAVKHGQADIGIVPSIEYHQMERMDILSGISIAAKGEVKSVLLLSKLPVEEIRSVALDNSSRTSAALLRVLLDKFYRRQVSFVQADPRPQEMLNGTDAALVIGDVALTYHDPSLRVYDLAAEWRKFTGLPFVFALWIGRREAQLARHRQDFEDSRSYGLAHVDEIVAEYAPKLNMTSDGVRAYLTESINYSLDEENRRGLQLFSQLAREVGIIPAERDLHFV